MDTLVKELGNFKGSGRLSVTLDLGEEDLIKSTSTLSDEAKKLPKIRVHVILFSLTCTWLYSTIL